MPLLKYDVELSGNARKASLFANSKSIYGAFADDWGGTPVLLLVALATIYFVLVKCTNSNFVLQCLRWLIAGDSGDILRGKQLKKLVVVYLELALKLLCLCFI